MQVLAKTLENVASAFHQHSNSLLSAYQSVKPENIGKLVMGTQSISSVSGSATRVEKAVLKETMVPPTVEDYSFLFKKSNRK